MAVYSGKNLCSNCSDEHRTDHRVGHRSSVWADCSNLADLATCVQSVGRRAVHNTCRCLGFCCCSSASAPPFQTSASFTPLPHPHLSFTEIAGGKMSPNPCRALAGYIFPNWLLVKRVEPLWRSLGGKVGRCGKGEGGYSVGRGRVQSACIYTSEAEQLLSTTRWLKPTEGQ